MTSGLEEVEVLNVEGPERYSFADVGHVLERALGRPVKTLATPRSGWVEAFKTQGFSQAAAEAYARMTGAAMDGTAVEEGRGEKCPTTLAAYLKSAVNQAGRPG